VLWKLGFRRARLWGADLLESWALDESQNELKGLQASKE